MAKKNHLGTAISAGNDLYQHLMDILFKIEREEAVDGMKVRDASLACRIWDDTIHGIRYHLADEALQEDTNG